MIDVLSRFRLDGRVAIVTGASSGLGVAFAEALAQAGADVALGARRVDKLAETKALVESYGRRAIAVATDVSDPASCEGLAAATREQLGRVDVLVNNAGVGTSVPALKETPEQFRSVIDVNLSGAYWMAQAAARVMAADGHGGSIVNISSVLGMTRSELPQAAYASSKAGLIGLTRDLANQWGARKGIRVNALAPGYFASEMTEPLLANDSFTGMALARTPLGRLGEPEELCAALLLLASDAGSYITGVTLPVDGGWTMP